MSDLIASYWADHPRQMAGFIAIFVVSVTAIYLFWRERNLRHHLSDLQPDRRLGYLLHHWQLRDYSLIFGMVITSSLFLAILPEKTANPTTPPPVTTECAPAPIDADAAAQVPPSDPNAMIGLFATDESWYPNDSTLDALKSRYENALIGSYVLHNCKRTTQDEMDTILKALRDDIMQFQADSANPPIDPQALYASIVSAAEGSYEMVYRRTDCNSPQTTMLEEQFAHFVMAYKGKITAPEAPPEIKKSRKHP